MVRWQLRSDVAANARNHVALGVFLLGSRAPRDVLVLASALPCLSRER